jgi:hypothetical protein
MKMCKPQNIIENLQISNDINLDALYEFMALGCTLNNKTFRGRKWKPKYINYPRFNKRESSYELILKKFEDYFSEFEGKEIAIMMSGGKDSRFLLEIANSQGCNVTGITLGITEKGNQENMIAKKVCNFLGKEHHFLKINITKESIDYVTTETPEIPVGLTEFLYGNKEKLSEMFDIIFAGDHLTYPKREERFYQKRYDTIADRTMPKISKGIIPEDQEIRIQKELMEKYKDLSLEEASLVNIKDGRFKRVDTINSFLDYRLPAINEDILNALWSIPEKENIKKMMKLAKHKTLKLPCTRSPFKLKRHWLIHYGYHILKNIRYINKTDMISNYGMGYSSGYKNKGKLYKDLMTDDELKYLKIPSSRTLRIQSYLEKI